MSYVKEKVSYLRGLCDGLEITDDTQRKLYTAIIETLDAVADAIDENEATLAELDECVSDIYDALDDVEEELYGEEDDDEEDDDDVEGCDPAPTPAPEPPVIVLVAVVMVLELAASDDEEDDNVEGDERVPAPEPPEVGVVVVVVVLELAAGAGDDDDLNEDGVAKTDAGGPERQRLAGPAAPEDAPAMLE